jgi:antitoxin HigA-1
MTISREASDRTNFDDVAERDLLAPVRPGEILHDEFMEPLGLSARALARELGVPPNRITEIVNGERGITAETAILLSRRFGTSSRFWMNLQVAHDLVIAERNMEHAA